ncbi:MAG TPA: 2-dehydropantoate 2-reductase [Aggregatilinea sp.]|uniref:ketopantoate reductase family protein n=1 Tax=Aggregatilinea sp. TaxID=2806333 RepID=UPI002CFD5FED|nr:2-dehydropantoate 2-reductase [Aggregatilinea sp.]HML20502.1 2-dehydropantoate 2-reductase [Aggregatilinea sp.]
MKPASTVSILGAGAMGAAYASRFYAMDPTCVSVVAQGERYNRLQRDGLIVNDEHYAIPVLTPEDTTPPSDLVIVALKHRDLAASLEMLRNRVGDNTVIVSVMNGLDSEGIIRSRFGDKVLYAISVGIDAQRQGNVINYSKIGKIVFGEPDNTVLSDRVRRVQELFDRASVPYDTPVDMIRQMWWKFMINVGINQASAVLRAPYGVFHTSQHAQAIMEAAMREVIAIAQASGVNMNDDDLNNWYPVMRSLHPQGRTSMLQDIEAGRETEVDIFAGKVVAVGLQVGVPTPVNELLLHAIKVIEQCPQ